MAWNEPGGSGNKDPWGGGRKDDQGPPDLDEVLKKMTDKINSLFGGKGGKGGDDSGRFSGQGGGSSIGISFVLILAVIVWGLSGLYIVNEGRQGVVLRLGAFDRITNPGLNWYPRFFEKVEIVDVEQVRSVNIGTVSSESLMLTQDENIVDIQFAVQYKVKDAKEYLFNVRDPASTLRQATETAMREIVGKNEMDFVIKDGRVEVATRTKDLMQVILDGYNTGVVVTNLNMQDAQPPEQVQHAFDDAIKAREDKERLVNEAEAYANDILPKARGKAARMEQEANAYRDEIVAKAEGEAERFTKVLVEYNKAPKVTRERLYLDAMESVLGNANKVMVDVKKGNNLMYLPLDRLNQRQSAPLDMTDLENQKQSADSANPNIADPRTRDGRLRSREVR
jgi:membrane protease subunit HflK